MSSFKNYVAHILSKQTHPLCRHICSCILQKCEESQKFHIIIAKIFYVPL